MKSLNGIAFVTAMILANNAFAICSNWKSSKIGVLDTRSVSEASGLVASKLQAGKLIWTNDSGKSATLYASGTDGKISRTVQLKGFQNTDFEALALGPCLEKKSESCIFVGDIGDGIGWRSNFKIGVFKESDFWNNTTISPVNTISYSYPKGDENAEAMFVTNDGKIIVLSKNESGVSEIYNVESSARVTHLGSLDLNSIVAGARGKGPRVTDASLSADGAKVLILTYGDIVEVNAALVTKPLARTTWKKGTDYNVVKGPALQQQETIAYTSANSFVVSSEVENGGVADIISYSCQ
jgi:hypothetical protein